ncbi:GTP-binding protein [Peribacillus sp. JNUCC 23]
MVSETLLIHKKFYETFVNDGKDGEPIQLLGEAYLEEQKKEVPELSTIRYAQGELYFHYKDFEAAIFKWENIGTELEPWAKKNVADAYYELGMHSTAEELYKSITSENLVLRAEVALQLFTLYIEEERFDLASGTIKNVVSFHPDYPNVTDLARSFFDSQNDWESAIELVVNESLRTGVLKWFDVLQGYVDLGYTKNLLPVYFNQVLELLSLTDQKRFEKLVTSLWQEYRQQDVYFEWLTSINTFFYMNEIDETHSWHDLANTFKDTYLELIDGHFLVHELQPIVPELLSNWLKLADSSQVMFASAAVLSWNEIFNEQMNPLVVGDAENRLAQIRVSEPSFQASSTLYEDVIQWSTKHDVDPGEKTKWLVEVLKDLETQHLLITGTEKSEKSSFVNNLLGAELSEEETPAYLIVRDSDEPNILEVTETERIPLLDLRDISPNAFIELNYPSPFLQDHSLTLIDAPPIDRHTVMSPEFLSISHTADSMVFVLDAVSPFTDYERDMLLQIKKRAPHLSIHFVMNRMDKISSESEARRILDETTERIVADFPRSNVVAYSSEYNSRKQMQDASEFVAASQTGIFIEQLRTDALLYYIRQTLTSLLEKRVEMENERVESIAWNEEMVVKVNGAINQLKDLEKEKIKTISKNYRLIKEEVKNDLKVTIPKLLRESSELVKEDSDFSQIHLTLNDEMNVRIQDYMNRRVLPRFYNSLQHWIMESKQDFTQCQYELNEMAEGFNVLYRDNRMDLQCDFKVLDDWSRDADRMTSGVRIDHVNILLRHTPSQLLLKGAGKLFGSIGQNKAGMYTRYKKYLETMDYDNVAEMIARKFLSQFELFEKSLDRDITMFFRGAKGNLHAAVEQSEYEIKENQAALDKMRERPEQYRDPITLFEVRLHQYEWMQKASR